MIVIYCECCGVLLKVAKVDATLVCDDCLDGKPRRKRGRDSAMIHYSALFPSRRKAI
jgi:hypothetical protein